MRIIKRGALEDFSRVHPDARASLESWYSVVDKANWQTPAEMKQVYPKADLGGAKNRLQCRGKQVPVIARVNY